MKFFNEKKEYRISLTHDDWVSPEETLVDSHSNYSDLEQPISTNVFRISLAVVVVTFLIVAVSSFNMSILGYASYADLAEQNRTVNFSIAPPRGTIFDSKGRPLVKNIPSFDLIVISRELPKDVQERLSDIEPLAHLLNTTPQELMEFLDTSSKKSSIFVVASDITKEKILTFTQLNPQGFYMVATTKRQYLDGHQFSTIVGYTGKVNKDDLSEDSYYVATDSIGRAGVEARYESTLRGAHGRIFFTQDTGGSVRQEPRSGDSIVLNVDQDVQKILYTSLFTILRTAGLSKAAAVVQDPRSGAVLGMVSFPGYDNNIFSSQVSQTDFEKLFLNPNKPLFNRVVSGLYNPGSTIKPFMGLMGLQEGVISTNTTIQDCIELVVPNPFNPEEPSIFKNWRPDLGAFNLRRSIADSCNVFFYRLGGGYEQQNGLGISRIVKYLKQGFADALLGIDLPGEEKGFVPTPEWKKETRNEDWYRGDTYNISIGQGDLLVSPLWINTYISAIANGGTIYKPLVTNRIIDDNKNAKKIYEATALGQLSFRDDVLREIKNDMAETVRSGTARSLSNLPVTVGAKTGTAEVVKNKSINSLFTAFAPLENPEVAITVLIEGSPSNEGHATRTAYEFLQAYFSKPNPSINPQLTE